MGHGDGEHRPPGTAAAYLVGPAFLLLAAWFLWGPDLLEIPVLERTSIHPSMIDTAPRRLILTDPPTIQINGFDRTCMECHRRFPQGHRAPGELLQHTGIDLSHGINTACDDCHHAQDRNQLVRRDGTMLGFDRVVDLCAECHGPVHRDWGRGSHGRTNGHWDPARGERRRLKCTECHDPHDPRHPAMDPLTPLPPPRTLRTVAPDSLPHRSTEPESERDPLRRALHGNAGR